MAESSAKLGSAQTSAVTGRTTPIDAEGRACLDLHSCTTPFFFHRSAVRNSLSASSVSQLQPQFKTRQRTLSLHQNPNAKRAHAERAWAFHAMSSVKSLRSRDFGFLPIPSRCRYDVDSPPAFTLGLNILFAFAATITVMNLYYVQPMLVDMANDFQVDYDTISKVAVLCQAGYAVGILLLTPLGDLLRRRQLTLALLAITTALSVGLALTKQLAAFEALAFLIGIFTVTPQVMIPLSADLAPPERRASAMSITLSGLLLGMLCGRVLSGTVAEFSGWRNTYWLAVGLQAALLVVLFFVLPDYPDKAINMTYPQVLWSMGRYLVNYPTLVQACMLGFVSSACFAGFWTLLTFLLSDEPYRYNTFIIGLFGLLGAVGVLCAPFTGRLVDHIVPWFGQMLGVWVQLAGLLIALGGAQVNIAAVIITCIVFDLGLQLGQVSNASRVANIDPKARARLNSCYILSLFLGQTTGTAVLTKLYNSLGWRPTAAVMVGALGFSQLVLLARGPHTTKWFGWQGGRQLLKRKSASGHRTEVDLARGEPERELDVSATAVLETDANGKMPGHEDVKGKA